MSRIKKTLTVGAGAAAGLFMTALASSAAAGADPAGPIIPGLPGVVDQVIASSANLPQQLLQTTASALTGSPLTSPAPAGPAPIATATINLPQTPAGLTPGAVPATGASTLPGLTGPLNLSSVLPFPLPNLGGTGAVPTGTTITTPALNLPGAFLPSAPATVPSPATVTVPLQTLPGAWMPVSGLP